MQLQKDLQMEGNQFAWLATAFFIAYAVGELPQSKIYVNACTHAPGWTTNINFLQALYFKSSLSKRYSG